MTSAFIDRHKKVLKSQSSHKYKVQMSIKKSSLTSEVFDYAYANSMLCTSDFICKTLKVCLSKRVKQVLIFTSLRV